MTTPFGDRLLHAIREKKSATVVGLDPVRELLPPEIESRFGPGKISKILTHFCTEILRAVADFVPAVKPNIAFFEAHGLAGMESYNDVCAFARDRGLLVIGDIKRGDIGSTAAAYAKGHLAIAPLHVDDHILPLYEQIGPHDAVTLQPYLGSDSIFPFLTAGHTNGQGFFVLVKTSNPSSSDFQDLPLRDGGTVAEAVARKVHAWGEAYCGPESGLSSIGAVIGATHPQDLIHFRAIMPHTPFLIPGYGAQGGTAEDVVGAFRPDGSGALVSASRSILYAWRDQPKERWPRAARLAVQTMNAEIASALQRRGISLGP